MEVQICQISVWDMIEGLCQQVGQTQWDLAGHGHSVPEPRHVGPPQSSQNDSLAWGSCNFSTTLPRIAAGGKAYASRSSHGSLRASTAEAMGSGTRDTNRGNLLLNLVVNRSILGRCHLLHIVWKTSGRRNHSVWMVWPSLDSLSATTFSQPGICRALRVTCFLVHQVKILHSRAQSEPDLMPPSLFMYDTTVVLSVATRAILSEQRS